MLNKLPSKYTYNDTETRILKPEQGFILKDITCHSVKIFYASTASLKVRMTVKPI